MKVRDSTRHVGRVGQGQEGVRLLLVVELLEGAHVDEVCGQPVVLFVGAVGEHDAIGLGELGDLANPGKQLLVFRRCGVQTGNGR